MHVYSFPPNLPQTGERSHTVTVKSVWLVVVFFPVNATAHLESLKLVCKSCGKLLMQRDYLSPSQVRMKGETNHLNVVATTAKQSLPSSGTNHNLGL